MIFKAPSDSVPKYLWVVFLRQPNEPQLRSWGETLSAPQRVSLRERLNFRTLQQLLILIYTLYLCFTQLHFVLSSCLILSVVLIFVSLLFTATPSYFSLLIICWALTLFLSVLLIKLSSSSSSSFFRFILSSFRWYK